MRTCGGFWEVLWYHNRSVTVLGYEAVDSLEEVSAFELRNAFRIQAECFACERCPKRCQSRQKRQ